MAHLNGTVTKDAKVITTQNGKQFAAFDLVENMSYKDKDGKRVQKSFYYNCIYWIQPEKIAPYITKGTILSVQCNVVARAYTDSAGNAKASSTATIETIKFLGRRSKSLSTEEAPKLAATEKPETIAEPVDDLPF
ncbi:single-stranded DNA-binding protein [Longitalea luteola]|uniref:single-stranded DNA-binding protein n=1 Tax=Longitalea luteola TaxID=2812563 RepID=UPI001A957C5E|nr:single-stranded DNA-binding protein [Longitalea luteola]